MTIEDQSYVFTWILPKHHNSGISALYTREQRAVSWPSWTAAVGSGYNAVTLSQAVSWPSCHKLFLDQAGSGQLLLDQVTMHKPRPWETSSAWRCQKVLKAFLIFYNQQEVKKPISFLTILFSGSRPASVLVRSIGNKLTNNLANLSRSIQ